MTTRILKRGAGAVLHFPTNQPGLRLRAIEVSGFNCADRTMLRRFLEKNKDVHLGKADVVMFRSKTKAQLSFVYDFREVEGAHGTRSVQQSVRLFISNGTWEPQLLETYIRDSGLPISMDGVKKFQRFFREQQEQAAQERIAKTRRAKKAA